MNLRNRIATVTRWPFDPTKRIERAIVDRGFAEAMAELFGADDELDEIDCRAFRIQADAQDELMRQGRTV